MKFLLWVLGWCLDASDSWSDPVFEWSTSWCRAGCNFMKWTTGSHIQQICLKNLLSNDSMSSQTMFSWIGTQKYETLAPRESNMHTCPVQQNTIVPALLFCTESCSERAVWFLNLVLIQHSIFTAQSRLILAGSRARHVFPTPSIHSHIFDAGATAESLRFLRKHLKSFGIYRNKIKPS